MSSQVISRPRTWLFDLDNTLHNASAHIFPHIGRSMRDYICRHLDLDEAAATQLRQHYWRRYGATLLGLMRHHDIDPRHFLHHTHQFPNLSRMVVAESPLQATLRRLPGRKIIFSNAPIHYTEAILSIIGIRRCFGAVYSVEQLRYQPKPAIRGFLRVLRGEGLDPRRCIMVEDTLPNLMTAKRLGMKTVWVTRTTRRPPCVDVQIRSVLDLPGRLASL
ncbi:pyrimidine 5'-nucleotidase [Propionivibrio sp.]|uniref:pyrimidine 5'-nucleotidase n=1 Tax=Propionivibrio sp. TaxID=2212460 RepID=UPI00272E5C60|nr:pyrimidine 5'-nucleotidase [Propionivibrio sp.]